MTTIFKKTVCCSVCGTSNEVTALGSTMVQGYPDLDSRPPEMMRSAMMYLIQKCSNCGYVAKDLENSSSSKAIVYSESYKQQLFSADFPELANNFLCFAILNESEDNLVKAGWAALEAAWACDDSRSKNAARICRTKAIDFFKKVIESGQKFYGDENIQEAILVDLYRRSGCFSEAMAVCERALNKIHLPELARIFSFEKSLIEINDIQAHNTFEAKEWI